MAERTIGSGGAVRPDSRAARAAVSAVRQTLASRGLDASDRVAIAFSGGPDSTALLSALVAAGWSGPTAIYVDHGLRPREELDAELSLVRSSCHRLGARLVVARVRPGAIAERCAIGGEGVEAVARRYRYSALRAASKKHGAVAVLLAHTRDDQAETILMRLFGGSGAGGLRGMPRSSGLFLRPFLGLGKSLLLEYLSESDLKYSTDSTNASGEFLRNRVRRGLIPALDAAMPGWRKGLCLAADKASSDEEALGSMSEAMAFRGTGPGEVETRAEALLSASGAVAERAIVSAAGALLGRPRFPHAAARAALAALRGTGSRRYLGAGLEILVRDGSVIMRRGLDFPRRGGYFVLIDRPLRVRVGAVEVIAAWRERGRSGIRADAFSFPLVVRSRRPGDAIASRCGTKRLDALFSEWGISAAFRGRAPVVEDRDGIVAVLGASLGGKDRFRWRPGIEISEGASMPLLSVIVKGA